MPYDSLFSLANLAVLPGWLLFAVAPRWRWSQRYAMLITPLLLGPVYVWLIATNWGDGGFNSLSGVAQLFSNRGLLLAGWIHYLIFDLFTGSWETRDATANRIPHWAVAPCLLFTFLLGPAGLLLYLLIRFAWLRFRPMESNA
ncbi:MAG: DUF4281 domain-containing protein [Bryobacterales bacterium]|nr:DUF4281 domain-containing protein [Bryobacterales bacterium]